MLFLVLLQITLAAKRYVIVSSSELAQVLYWPAPAYGSEMNEGDRNEPQVLISTGLVEPIGIAVDQERHGLYVADPGADGKSGKVWRYVLTPTASGLEVGAPFAVLSNIQVRWLTLDAHGTLFVTDEGNNVVYKVPAEHLVRPAEFSFLEGSATGSYTDLPVEPITLYDGKQVSGVSAPSGIAVDNYRVFWANKVSGTEVGSVVQGYEAPPPASATAVTAVASNTIKVYGVCMSSSNVFFTDAETYLYGVKKFGGGVAAISDKMKDPRGCAWDGDGTVYVADKKGKVYSFAANMRSLSPQQLTHNFDVSSPEGVAVFIHESSARLATAFAAIVFAMMS